MPGERGHLGERYRHGAVAGVVQPDRLARVAVADSRGELRQRVTGEVGERERCRWRAMLLAAVVIDLERARNSAITSVLVAPSAGAGARGRQAPPAS